MNKTITITKDHYIASLALASKFAQSPLSDFILKVVEQSAPILKDGKVIKMEIQNYENTRYVEKNERRKS